MTFNLTGIVVPTLTFGKVEKGQVFLLQDSYYFKVGEDNAVRIGVVNDYIFETGETLWDEVEFDSDLHIDKVFPNVSITFN